MVQVNEINKEDKEEKEESFTKRVIEPLYEYICKLIFKMTPKQKIKNLSKRLDAAGLLRSGNVESWLYKSFMMSFVAACFLGFMSYLIVPNMLKAIVLAALIMGAIQFAIRFYISSKIDKRKLKIIRSLPFTLDLITVSVEAGLSFDGAIARVINNIHGELSDEFAKTLKEIKMGIERRVALRNMSDRCDIKELSMFITSIIQADNLGVSLGKVLRIESSGLREHRKQVAREKAMKAPVKMLFPLILFIFPAIFVIILGPAAIKTIQMFMG